MAQYSWPGIFQQISDDIDMVLDFIWSWKNGYSLLVDQLI